MNLVIFLGLAYGIVGVVLLYWARPFSLRYNAWTTSFRQRHPGFNPPPTPEMRLLNTKIMTNIFRTSGAFFIFLSLLTLVPLMGSAGRQIR